MTYGDEFTQCRAAQESAVGDRLTSEQPPKLFDRDSASLGRAEMLFKGELTADENALGPEHPNVAQRLQNLADVYRMQGQHAKARPLFERALRIFEKVHGPDHPSVAFVLTNLAAIDITGRRFSSGTELQQTSCNHASGVPSRPSVYSANHQQPSGFVLSAAQIRGSRTEEIRNSQPKP